MTYIMYFVSIKKKRKYIYRKNIYIKKSEKYIYVEKNDEKKSIY